jgi:hypothetical protein
MYMPSRVEFALCIKPGEPHYVSLGLKSDQLFKQPQCKHALPRTHASPSACAIQKVYLERIRADFPPLASLVQQDIP